mgnify:FL=1
MKFKDEEKILNKELSGSQLSKGYVESIIKMKYEEFENLDIEDQNKLIEDIVIEKDNNVKIIFKCEDKYFEALDFINRQKCDIIASS